MSDESDPEVSDCEPETDSSKGRKRHSGSNRKKQSKRTKSRSDRSPKARSRSPPRSDDSADLRIAKVVARIIQSHNLQSADRRAELCLAISDLRSENIYPAIPVELRDSTKTVSVSDFGIYLHSKWFAIDNQNMFQAICDFAAEVFDLLPVSEVRYNGYRAYITDALTSAGSVIIGRLGEFVESQSSNSVEFQNVIDRATRAGASPVSEAARWSIIGVFGAMVMNMKPGSTTLADAMLTRVREHAIISANIKNLQTEISATTRRLDQLTVSLDAIQKVTAFPINNMEIG